MAQNTPNFDDSVVALRVATIDRLRSSRGEAELQRSAVIDFVRKGSAIGLTVGELTDYFCVSTPNIVEEAGYVGGEGDRLASVFDEVCGEILK